MSGESCIYSITNLVNGKRLIGQTNNFAMRKSTHQHLLKRCKHHNPHFQFAWNKYGENNFRFEILTLCPVEKLDEEEIRLIKEYRTMEREYGYNVFEGGNRPTFTDEIKKKMREAQLGPKSHLFGKKRSDQVRANISKGKKERDLKKGKLTSLEILEIRKLHSSGQYTYAQIASIFNDKVKDKFIGRIVRHDAYQDVC